MIDSLDSIVARLKDLTPEELEKIAQDTVVAVPEKWIPTVGPQRDAYYCKADVLLFG